MKLRTQLIPATTSASQKFRNCVSEIVFASVGAWPCLFVLMLAFVDFCCQESRAAARVYFCKVGVQAAAYNAKTGVALAPKAQTVTKIALACPRDRAKKALRWPEDGPKMARDGPTQPQAGARWPKMVPKWPQGQLENNQGSFKVAPKWFQGGRRVAQDVPKTSPSRPKRRRSWL